MLIVNIVLSRYARLLNILLLTILLISVGFPSRLTGSCTSMFLVWALEIKSDITLFTIELHSLVKKLLFREGNVKLRWFILRLFLFVKQYSLHWFSLFFGFFIHVWFCRHAGRIFLYLKCCQCWVNILILFFLHHFSQELFLSFPSFLDRLFMF